MKDKEKVVVMVDEVCESAGIRRPVEKLYTGGDLLEVTLYGDVWRLDYTSN